MRVRVGSRAKAKAPSRGLPYYDRYGHVSVPRGHVSVPMRTGGDHVTVPRAAAESRFLAKIMNQVCQVARAELARFLIFAERTLREVKLINLAVEQTENVAIFIIAT